VSLDESQSQDVRVEGSTAVGHPPVTDYASRRGVREWKRSLLFAVLPIALVAGAYAYTTGGRIVSIDDAYVDTDKVGVSTDIAGTVAEVAVSESQRVAWLGTCWNRFSTEEPGEPVVAKQSRSYRPPPRITARLCYRPSSRLATASPHSTTTAHCSRRRSAPSTSHPNPCAWSASTMRRGPQASSTSSTRSGSLSVLHWGTPRDKASSSWIRSS
jgi:hypothetical protein